MSQNQGMGDLYRIYLTVLDFNLAYIPKTFTHELEEPFDTAYMNELYRLGYDQAVKGQSWVKAPPGFN
jgi:hypothetical protein